MKNLINEAKERINEIVEETKKGYSGYTAIYFSDNGISIANIPEGQETRTETIAFGYGKKSESEILEVIEREEYWQEMEFQHGNFNG